MNVSLKAINLPAGATQWTGTVYVPPAQWDTGYMQPGATKTLVVNAGEATLYFDAYEGAVRLTDGQPRGVKTLVAGTTYTYDFQTATLTEGAGGPGIPGGLGLIGLAIGAILVVPRLLKKRR